MLAKADIIILGLQGGNSAHELEAETRWGQAGQGRFQRLT